MQDRRTAKTENNIRSTYLQNPQTSLPQILLKTVNGVITDSEDLYYMRARYYSTDLRRFLSEDDFVGKYDDISAINLYGFVNGDPILGIDPSGYFLETAVDVVSIGFSAKDLYDKPSWSNLGYLIWDVSAAAIPMIPGSWTVKGMKAGAKGLEALKNLEKGKDVIKGGLNASEEMTTLYRAVGPKEFYNVMETGKFSVIPQGLQAKQFGLNLEQTIKFAEKYLDLAAVIEVKVPKSVADKLGDLTPVDGFIFKDGTLTIHVDDLEEFNKAIQSLSHKY